MCSYPIFYEKILENAVYKGVEPLPQDRQSSILAVIRIHHNSDSILFLTYLTLQRTEQGLLIKSKFIKKSLVIFAVCYLINKFQNTFLKSRSYCG